jgi:putative transposase
MPNHFHLMVLVNFEEIEIESSITHQMTQSHQMSNRNSSKKRTFAAAIAIMLRSYTRAINKQENLSGSLFRAHTKAECITCTDGIEPPYYMVNGITQINTLRPAEEQYPQVCFNYIHQNPVSAGLVNATTEWEFSSARDYAGQRNGKLINREVAEEFVDF